MMIFIAWMINFGKEKNSTVEENEKLQKKCEILLGEKLEKKIKT